MISLRGDASFTCETANTATMAARHKTRVFFMLVPRVVATVVYPYCACANASSGSAIVHNHIHLANSKARKGLHVQLCNQENTFLLDNNIIANVYDHTPKKVCISKISITYKKNLSTWAYGVDLLCIIAKNKQWQKAE